MRYFVALLSLVFTFNVFACEQYEAQFVGTVYAVDDIDETGCELAIEFDLYDMHALCPLFKEEAVVKTIKADETTCKLINNTHTGGILVRKAGSETITLEI